MAKAFNIKDDPKEAARAVAYLTGQGIRQGKIRDLLGFDSQAKVSRSLQLARKEGLVRTEINWGPDPEIREQIKRLVYKKEKFDILRNWLNKLADGNRGVPFTDIYVVYSGSKDDSKDKRFQLFGRNCAHRVAALLEGVKTCAVAWGRTMQMVVAGIESLGPFLPSHDMQFMPLSGEPINHEAPGMSSTSLAEKIAQAFGSENERLVSSSRDHARVVQALSLRGVGVRIPKDCGKDADVIRRFVEYCKAYKKIFAPPEQLITKIGAVLTGVGDAGTSEKDPWFKEIIEAENLSDAELRQMAVGNIGGVWFAKSKQHESRVQEINERWLGIKKEHFEDCARRAAGGGDTERPGVMVVAIGKSKKNIVERVAGMTNFLIIDSTLADTIYDEAQKTLG